MVAGRRPSAVLTGKELHEQRSSYGADPPRGKRPAPRALARTSRERTAPGKPPQATTAPSHSTSLPALPMRGSGALSKARVVAKAGSAVVRLSTPIEEAKAADAAVKPTPEAPAAPSPPRNPFAAFGRKRTSSVGALLNKERERLKAEETKSRYESMRSRSSLSLHLGDWTSAEESLSDQITMSSKNAVLFNSRSYCNLKLNRLSTALSDADRAVSLEPHSPIGHYRRAQALCKAQRPHEAGNALLASLDHSGADGPATDDGGFVDLPNASHAELRGMYGLPRGLPMAAAASKQGGGGPRPTTNQGLPRVHQLGSEAPELVRFGDVLGRIRRERHYWQSGRSAIIPPIMAAGSKRSGQIGTTAFGSSPTLQLPAALRRSRGGLGPDRLHLLGDDNAPMATVPTACAPPEPFEIGMHAIDVKWSDPQSTGAEDIDYFVLQYAAILEPEEPEGPEEPEDGDGTGVAAGPASGNAHGKTEASTGEVAEVAEGDGEEGAEGAEGSPKAPRLPPLETLEWLQAYRGPQHTFELIELETDTAYAVRVAAANFLGVGEWSKPLVVSTLALEEERAETELPAEWLDLRAQLEHLLGPKEDDRARDVHWEALVAALLKHQRSLRIAFRLNVLLGGFLNQAAPPSSRPGTQGSGTAGKTAANSSNSRRPSHEPQPSATSEEASKGDAGAAANTGAGAGATEGNEPSKPGGGEAFVLGKRMTNSLDQAQFRIFLHECDLLIPGKGGKAVSSTDADEIFRLSSATELEAEGAPIGGFGLDGSRPQTAHEASRLSQHEFVLAVLLLARARYEGTGSIEADDKSPLSSSLEQLMQHHLIPKATFEVFDEMSRTVKERKVRTILSKHGAGLTRAFKLYSAAVLADEADAAPTRGGGSGQGGHAPPDEDDDDSLQQLDLPELLTMLQDAKMLDDRCTARDVITFFARVNLDDELFTAVDGAKAGTNADSTQLDYDEYLEIICRVCDKKMPERILPFAETLDKWLGLLFLPAVKAKGRKLKMRTIKTRFREGSLLDQDT